MADSFYGISDKGAVAYTEACEVTGSMRVLPYQEATLEVCKDELVEALVIYKAGASSKEIPSLAYMVASVWEAQASMVLVCWDIVAASKKESLHSSCMVAAV